MARQQTAVYVYGIVPADVEIEQDAHGVGDPPSTVKLVWHNDIAALVSEIDLDRPLGRPEDLAAHAGLLDLVAAEVPVLPLRFGAVLSTVDGVTDELLAVHHDEFRDALAELEGKAEYVVRGRYDEQGILGEILAEQPRLRELREAIHDKPDDATRNERITLGESIGNAINRKRAQDSQMVLDRLGGLDILVNNREPTHELDAVHIACLIETDRQAELEQLVEELAGQWEGRMNLRLLGPLAPYDFVTTGQPVAG
jgi:gas vesicle protein GvpL/GvpF